MTSALPLVTVNLTKLFTCIYETAVYTIVNGGGITHQNSKYQKRLYCSAVHWHL